MDESPALVQSSKWGFGPIVAIVILIAIFALGGVYFFMREQARLSAPPIQETINA
jgi:hypothetical protein